MLKRLKGIVIDSRKKTDIHKIKDITKEIYVDLVCLGMNPQDA